ncbi:MAG: DUF3025 domain-containing protein [Proteobacteria bacterium]|uniref:DUF3025 domain-containing protein n=1 Tax=Rudaea sp. TaxID=2136325 RepID=UPI003783732C|nr:DUF3025 domain-containing protein [Pseudomonadota bacterium]
MRFVAPARAAVDATVFDRPPLMFWEEFGALLRSPSWPAVAEIDALRGKLHNVQKNTLPHFIEQSAELLRDGLHYEERIGTRGEIATRPGNWHDLLNALIWLRYPTIKQALNARQLAGIVAVGPRQRTRAQCALTHFDEAGVIVQIDDPALLASWNAHDWHGLFWRERAAWSDGRIRVDVFGHALLEHALQPAQLLVGKAIAIAPCADMPERLALAIDAGKLLNDPLELRPLPLSGIPGWHAGNEDESFYAVTPCFRACRAGRSYPPAMRCG